MKIPSKVVQVSNQLAPKAKSFLQKLAKPWTITGPTSSPEFKDPVLAATEFRKFAPATAPMRPSVPHAEPDGVFNIAYFTRDRRRNLKPRKVEEADPEALATDPWTAPPLKQFVMGKAVRVDDEPGGGYQK